jgi:hypothetical protein
MFFVFFRTPFLKFSGSVSSVGDVSSNSFNFIHFLRSWCMYAHLPIVLFSLFFAVGLKHIFTWLVRMPCAKSNTRYIQNIFDSNKNLSCNDVHREITSHLVFSVVT